MLGLEAEPAMLDDLAGIELQARLGREELERPPARRIEHPRRERQGGSAVTQVEVVVVAAAAPQLPVTSMKARANGDWLLEIEW